jgi:fructose/tagatose bisphosphate aldolase
MLQISENCVSYHGGLAPLAAATLCLAQSASQPVCVQLDHAVSQPLVSEAIELGLSAVMFDGSLLDYPTNLSETALVAQACHSRGVSVEAELGIVGGKGGVHLPGRSGRGRRLRRSHRRGRPRCRRWDGAPYDTARCRRRLRPH